MNTKRIARNSIWLLVGRLATAGLNLILTVMIARFLGESGYGRYAFMISLVYLGNTATTFGMDTFVMRAVAQEQRGGEEAMSAALILQLLLSLLYMLLIGGLSLLWSIPKLPLYIFLLLLLPLAFGTIYSAILRGLERMDMYVIYTLAGSLLQMGGTLTVLWWGGDLWGIALVAFFSQTVATLIVARLIPSTYGRFSWWSISWRAVYGAAKQGWVLALLAVFAVLFAQLPIFMLGITGDDALVGLYSAAGRLVDGGKLLPAALFGALFPQLVQGAGQAPRYRQLFWGIVFLFVLIVATGVVFARPIMQLLYGGYDTAVPVLQILLIGLLPFLFRLRYSFELITQGDEWPVLVTEGIAFLVAVPTYYFLMRWQPLLGVSIALIFITALQAILLKIAGGKIWGIAIGKSEPS